VQEHHRLALAERRVPDSDAVDREMAVAAGDRQRRGRRQIQPAWVTGAGGACQQEGSAGDRANGRWAA
jgi:hypothetical protein